MTAGRCRCFACDREIRAPEPCLATTRDGQHVFVGSDCFDYIEKAGAEGYQPPKGGPRLFLVYPIGGAS